MEKVISKLYSNSSRSIYLAFFRLFICFHIMKKILLQWSSLYIVYSPDSFVEPYIDPLFQIIGKDAQLFFHANYNILFFLYMIFIIFYAFGIGKHITAFVVYLFLEIIQRLNGYILNGGDNFLKFLLLYLVFADTYEYFSLNKLTIKSQSLKRLSNLFTNLSVYSIITHLCLIYFIAGIYKLNSHVWFNGVALYYILFLERFKGSGLNNELAKNGYFVTLATYFTMFWETFFPVLIWIKKLRHYILILGLLLHIGIYVFMMIYDFEIVFVMTYGFFFENNEILALKEKLINILLRIKNKISEKIQIVPTP